MPDFLLPRYKVGLLQGYRNLGQISRFRTDDFLLLKYEVSLLQVYRNLGQVRRPRLISSA